MAELKTLLLVQLEKSNCRFKFHDLLNRNYLSLQYESRFGSPFCVFKTKMKALYITIIVMYRAFIFVPVYNYMICFDDVNFKLSVLNLVSNLNLFCTIP